MKKQITLALLLLAAVAAPACTNFIVGKKASADGSVICSYNADDYGMFIGLCHYPAARHAKGAMRDIVNWDTHRFIGRIPEAAETYNVIGNINEYQVSIGETTYGGREEMVDPQGGIDYGSLIYLGLQRSKTAREAIRVMTTLAETHGYCSEGETFTICDPNEAWVMEMMGKGPGSKSVVWVAQRIPDNAICGHANQSRIGKFDMRDKENVIYSRDVVKFARQKGWFTGKDAKGGKKDVKGGKGKDWGQNPHKQKACRDCGKPLLVEVERGQRVAVERVHGDHAAVHHTQRGRVAALGKGDGAGVATGRAAVAPPQLPQMGVARDHQVEAAGRQLGRAVDVAVGEQHAPPLVHEQRIVGHHGEAEQHLIHLGVAVAAHGHDVGGHVIEQGRHALAVDALGNAVARAVIDDIAQQEQHVAPLRAVEVEGALQPWQRPVDVGKEQVFHGRVTA